MSNTCSLSIMVARTDLPFMEHTIPHIVRSCHFPFLKRVLVVDTAPLSGDKVNRPGIGTMDELRQMCSQFIDRGFIDETIDMDYSSGYRQRIYQKHFGTARLQPTHNHKGYPILGSIQALEEVPGDYVLHFDSDMLLHQQPDFNWIQKGIELLQKRDDVMFVRPLSGPPGEENSFFQNHPYSTDSDGFYGFKFFGSRVFLMDRKKFEKLLPLPILWHKYRNAWMRKLPVWLLTEINRSFGKGHLDSWEVMISRNLEATSFVRATLTDPQAWTIHPIDRGPEFIKNLPRLIELIENGEYPPEQAGHYDFDLEAWLRWSKLSALPKLSDLKTE